MRACYTLALTALMIPAGAALAEPQPLTSLPLQAQGENLSLIHI